MMDIVIGIVLGLGIGAVVLYRILKKMFGGNWFG